MSNFGKKAVSETIRYSETLISMIISLRGGLSFSHGRCNCSLTLVFPGLRAWIANISFMLEVVGVASFGVEDGGASVGFDSIVAMSMGPSIVGFHM